MPSSQPVVAFPRVPHTLLVQILIWLNCISLIACGAVSMFYACTQYKYLTHVFLSLYLIIFGILALAAEIRFNVVVCRFGILCTKYGLAFFFIFAGTLGISFGIGKSAAILVPFISGIASVAIGILSFTEEVVLMKLGRQTTATVEAVESSEPLLHNQHPHDISIDSNEDYNYFDTN